MLATYIVGCRGDERIKVAGSDITCGQPKQVMQEPGVDEKKGYCECHARQCRCCCKAIRLRKGCVDAVAPPAASCTNFGLILFVPFLVPDQVGPKMWHEGAKMGTRRGQDGHPEAQVGSRSGQTKKGPKIEAILGLLWGPFWGPCRASGGHRGTS